VREGRSVAGVRYRSGEAGEKELEATAVVGADGPGSVVREQLDLPCRRFAGSPAYVLGTPSATRTSDELAVHCGPGYADGVVPLRDGTYFWDCVTSQNQAAVEARDLAGWREAFERRLPPGSELPHAIESWEELTVVRVRPFWAQELVADGAVLAGDAAGTVHPHSAQGANLALEDAVALGEALPRGALESYARSRGRRRRGFVLWSLLAALSMDAPNVAWRAVRRSGFAWNRVGPMRRTLLRRQAGLA
jgi:2-polyprenyl-6-methoxyphenol hydroxylase-like FAD-dependent oxidoreductase